MQLEMKDYKFKNEYASELARTPLKYAARLQGVTHN